MRLETLFQIATIRHAVGSPFAEASTLFANGGGKKPPPEDSDDEAPELPTDEPAPLPIQDPPSEATPPEPMTV